VTLPTSRRRTPKRWLGPAVGVAALVLLGMLIWHFAGSSVGVRREAPRIATITPLPKNW